MKSLWLMLGLLMLAGAAFAGGGFVDSVCVDTFYVNGEARFIVACDLVWAKWEVNAPHEKVVEMEAALGADTFETPLPQWVHPSHCHYVTHQVNLRALKPGMFYKESTIRP